MQRAMHLKVRGNAIGLIVRPREAAHRGLRMASAAM
jgi:hypothetical protein